jgi:signal transduction histidine kinase
VLEHDRVHVLAPEGSSEAMPPGGSAVEASMRSLVERLGSGSGLVTALPMAGRTVGAIVLAGAEDHDWTGSAVLLLEPLAPQLAAGLAQVVLVRDQRDALESIERVDRMRDRLIANVSHELRTPLTSTMGFVETVLRDDIDLDERTRHELLLHARDGGLRLLSLVEDLLALGSTRPESLDLSPEPVDVARLVADSLRGIDPPDRRELRVRAQPGACATLDRNRVMQVIANLVVNALRHGRGDVLVDARSERERLLIDVVDEGPGVAPEHVHELFLPFARFSTRPDSTGLGLAICRTIVEAHGGTVTYARVDGRTRFRVQLPTLPASS